MGAVQAHYEHYHQDILQRLGDHCNTNAREYLGWLPCRATAGCRQLCLGEANARVHEAACGLEDCGFSTTRDEDMDDRMAQASDDEGSDGYDSNESSVAPETQEEIEHGTEDNDNGAALTDAVDKYATALSVVPQGRKSDFLQALISQATPPTESEAITIACRWRLDPDATNNTDPSGF